MKQIVKIGKKHAIRAVTADFKSGKIFVSDFDDGTVYYYNSMVPLSADTPLEMITSFKGPLGPRCLSYWPDRKELYIGCAEGKMVVYQLDKLNQGSTCTRIHPRG